MHDMAMDRTNGTPNNNFVHPLRLSLGLASLLGRLLGLGSRGLGGRELCRDLLLRSILLHLLALRLLGGIISGDRGLDGLHRLLDSFLRSGSLNSLGLLRLRHLDRHILDGLELREIDLVAQSLQLLGLGHTLALLLLNAFRPLIAGLTLQQALTLDLVPRGPLESAVGTLPDLGVQLLRGNKLALQDVAVHQVVVHGLGDDLGDGGGGEFNEGVVLGATGQPVA